MITNYHNGDKKWIVGFDRQGIDDIISNTMVINNTSLITILINK